MDGIRADQLLFDSGLASSRTKAQALILAGQVYRGEVRVDKPGETLPVDTVLVVREGRRHVSGGADKLEKGLDCFHLNPVGQVCLDLGASTGGFTEILLERGARKVYAVDVGWGQLDSSLRGDPRVILLERTNARDLTRAQIPEQVGIAVADLSFISLRKVLEPCLRLLSSQAELLPLFKPQFELGRRHVKKGGLALDFELHAEALIEFSDWCEALNLFLVDLVHAPVRGRRRNVEYMLYLRRERSGPGDIMSLVRQRVEEARTDHGKIED